MITTRILVISVLVLGVGLPGGITKADFTFGELVNLGSTVNSSNHDSAASVSADGMMLFFNSDRPGGMGGMDIWITELQTTRQMTELVWGKPINLKPVVNSAADEF